MNSFSDRICISHSPYTDSSTKGAVMKTAVITGSTRGLGYEMAKDLRRYGLNVILNGSNAERLEGAVNALKKIKGRGGVAGFCADVGSAEEVRALAAHAAERFGAVDIWINNAGVNQPMKAIWELSDDEVDSLIEIDLRGAVIGSRIAAELMESQPQGGYIYNVEGYGSNDAMMLGFNMYGTSKRAVTHFTVALAKELEERHSKVKAGRLSPGIVATDFLTNALGGEQKIELPGKTKRFYNIVAEPPDVVAHFLVKSMLANRKNNVRINRLTNVRLLSRFITAGYNTIAIQENSSTRSRATANTR